MNSFYTTSEEIRHIMKGLSLTKSLYVSSIVIGDVHIGKKGLLRHLFPKTPMISADKTKELEQLLTEHDELIITDFERCPNPQALHLNGKRIFATANYVPNRETIDTLFAFIYYMPSLKERPGDVRYLLRHFVQEACATLMVDADLDTILEDISIDLSSNSKSLRKSVYMHLVSRTMDEQALQEALYHYLLRRLEGNNAYRDHIGLFEIPLIKAGLKKYGSQLKLAEVLGINRNTLRKKIHEHGIH